MKKIDRVVASIHESRTLISGELRVKDVETITGAMS
jgi:hypothetical protein